jgi:hypothetical protein
MLNKLIYLILFSKLKNRELFDTCIVSTVLLFVLSLVVHKTSKSDKMSKSILAYFFSLS